MMLIVRKEQNSCNVLLIKTRVNFSFQLNSEFEQFSKLGAVKTTLERSFQNFTTSIVNDVPGFSMGGAPKLVWDLSNCFPKFDKKVFREYCPLRS